MTRVLKDIEYSSDNASDDRGSEQAYFVAVYKTAGESRSHIHFEDASSPYINLLRPVPDV
jgi:hypothetical protein